MAFGIPGGKWFRRVPTDESETCRVAALRASARNDPSPYHARVLALNMMISLAFLAPELVKAAVDGRLPRGIGVTRLRDAPAEWSRQYAMLGLSI